MAFSYINNKGETCFPGIPVPYHNLVSGETYLVVENDRGFEDLDRYKLPFLVKIGSRVVGTHLPDNKYIEGTFLGYPDGAESITYGDVFDYYGYKWFLYTEQK